VKARVHAHRFCAAIMRGRVGARFIMFADCFIVALLAAPTPDYLRVMNPPFITRAL
jgi:hypothetical protein